MKNSILKYASIFIILFLVLLLFSCGEEKDKITIGSKMDTEGALIGNMIILALENEGYETVDKTSLGDTSIVRSALLNDQIDIYPEYTGNGSVFFGDEVDQSVWKDPQKGYQTVKNLDKEKNNIVWLNSSPANNTWGIAVRRDLAESESIYSLEDFAQYINEGGEVKLACSAEFAESEAALPAFQEGYGFELNSNQLLIMSGGNTTQTQEAAYENRDGVNFAMAYGTDGSISAFNLLFLEDTKNIQPVYQPAPIVRSEIIEKFPKIDKVLNPIMKSLDQETLQELNGRIAVEGIKAKTAAQEYLEANGFLEGE